MTRRLGLVFLVWLAIVAPAPSSQAADAVLRIDAAASKGEVTREAIFHVSIAVFSTNVQTTTVSLAVPIDVRRFEVQSVEVSGGAMAVPDMYPHDSPPPFVYWMGSVRLEHPAMVVIKLKVRPSAPLGPATIRASGMDAGGHTSADSVLIGICCVEQPPAQKPPTIRRLLPIIRR
jgi:hypothetical protein